MSIEYLNASFNAQIKPSSTKFALVALCNFANEEGKAYPSIETLSKKTGQDRKTVLSNLKLLNQYGIITDTGMRKGGTKLVKVWGISIEKLEDIGETKLTPSNSPKNGTVKQSQKRDSLKDETVPFFPSNSPKNGTVKQSQKRYSEPSVSLTISRTISNTRKNSKQKEPTENKKPRDGPKEDLFLKFYSRYPKPVAKGNAKKAWKKIEKRLKNEPELFEKIMRGLERAMKTKDWLKEDKKYIPYPASWLNGERWEDDYSYENKQQEESLRAYH